MTNTAARPADAIVVRALSKSFGHVKAVDGLSFTAEPGRVTGFLGPNGAGKTTTLRMLLGLIKPDAGTATIAGRRYVDLPAPSSRVGAVLDAAGFHPARTGRNHLRVYCVVNGYPTQRADEVLELVGLTGAARRAVRGYSLGMRQRLALATAMLGNPDVVVLDEPANGLDPEGIAWIRRLLRDLASEGRTVLVSSHVLSEMQQLVDDVVIINRGSLVRQGRLAELFRDRTAVSIRTPDADALVAALNLSGGNGAYVERTGPDQLRVSGVTAERVGRVARLAGVELHQLADERTDLEHVFFELTGGAGKEVG